MCRWSLRSRRVRSSDHRGPPSQLRRVRAAKDWFGTGLEVVPFQEPLADDQGGWSRACPHLSMRSAASPDESHEGGDESRTLPAAPPCRSWTTRRWQSPHRMRDRWCVVAAVASHACDTFPPATGGRRRAESEGTAADGGGAVETPGADTPVR
jgi:hypothetical protein